ncbi:MAG: helix-turn-helix transcriptional regulator [Ruminococcaceae bacterium]|nr:helix-turn-helix transcriptional regulator [Oscillospiraceae bacterium]MBO5005920.1 helix-turn-helix transcriptional regulator [Clostridia bacterium]
MEKNIEMKGLKEIRIQKGLTQQKVALDLNISREALSYYENGKRCPDIQMLILLSDYFDVSIHYLITGSEFLPKYQK